MKIGIVVLCRYSSTRLPGKILKKINDKTILMHIINRLSQLNNVQLIVASSTDPSDDIIEQICNKNGINIFRGSLTDVSERFLNAAKSMNVDYAVRINGDNLFIDLDAFKLMIGITCKYNYDFITNVKGRSFPYGMSIEIVKVSFFENIIEKFNTKYYKEHVTIYLYERLKDGNIYFHYNNILPEASGLKFAIDTEKDFKNMSIIADNLNYKLQDYNLKDLISAYKNISS